MTPGMPAAPFGRGHLDPGQPVAVGRDGAHHRHLVVLGRVQIDAVQVVAGLLGRDRKAGAVDQGAQLAGGQREMMRQFAGRHHRVVLRRQAGEGEGRAARAQHHLVAPAHRLQLDLGAFAQLADDVVERVRRRGGAPVALDPRRRPRSTISRSMSVALSASWPASARSSTFDRIGIVVRRSTTLCTWLSALRRAARSMVSFMLLHDCLADRTGNPGRRLRRSPRWRLSRGPADGNAV